MISDDDDCVQLYLEKMVVPVESGGGEVCGSYTSAVLVRALVLSLYSYLRRRRCKHLSACCLPTVTGTLAQCIPCTTSRLLGYYIIGRTEKGGRVLRQTRGYTEYLRRYILYIIAQQKCLASVHRCCEHTAGVKYEQGVATCWVVALLKRTHIFFNMVLSSRRLRALGERVDASN